MRFKKTFVAAVAALLILSVFLPYIPPVEAQEPDPIGYKIIGDVVEIWNPDTTYYFNKSSGIQWTEDPNQYWSRNIFAIGYYSGGEWHKIFSADELGTFNREIDSDFTSYVNATLWKDFSYAGYDLRLGVRYHLKLSDSELSVTVYAKNLGDEAYPVPLGFAWRITDIKIGGTWNDKMGINATVYDLNSNLDFVFKNMTRTYSYLDPELNETVTVTYSLPYYRIFNDKEGYISLTWDENIPYAVHLFSDGSQDSSFIDLLINAGLFSAGQEKSTTIYWKDPETEILRPDANGDVIEWSATPDDNWENVDEVVADDGDSNNWFTYPAESGNHTLDLYSLGDSSGSGTINSINLYYRFWGVSAGAGQASTLITPCIKTGGTIFYGTVSTGNYAWQTKNYTWTENPDTSAAWTWSDLDSLQAGANASCGGVSGPPISNLTQAYVEVSYVFAPSNDGCVLTNPTDTDDILAQYATYIATVNVSHGNGYTDISTVNLTIQTGTPTERVTFLYTNSSDTFSEQAGATTAWELVTGSCVSTRAGDDIDLEFHFRAEWDATEESDLDFKVITVDSDGLSDTDTYDLNYDVITTLTVDSFASSPAEYINPSTSVTYSGTVYYVTEPGGSTASAFYAADAEFTDVEVHDAGHSVKGTDSSISNGAFSLAFNSDGSVGQDTYHPFIDMADADYTDADAPGITDTLTVEQIVFKTATTLEVGAAYADADNSESGLWYAELMYDSDDSELEDDGSVVLNTGSLSWDSGDGRWEYTITSASVQTISRNIASVSGNARSITSLASAVTDDSEDVIFDKVKCSGIAVSDARDDIGDTINIDFTLIYESDSAQMTDGTVTIEGEAAAHQGSGVWRLGDSEASVTQNTYNEFTATGNTRDIDTVNQNGQSDTAIWDRIQATGTAVSDTRDDIGDTVTVDWTLIYDFDNAELTDGTVTIEGEATAHQGSGVWRASPSEASVTSITFNEFTATGNTHGITAVDANGQTDTVIWDRVHCTGTTASDNRDDINDNVNVDFTLKYDFDEADLTDGTVTIEGFSAAHQGSGVWRITKTSAAVTSVLYNEFTATGGAYGITAVDMDGEGGETVIWDRIHATATSVSDLRDNVGDTVTVDWTLKYDHDETAVTDGTVTIEGVGAAHIGSGVWRISPNEASVTDITFNEFTATGNTHGITEVDANGQTDTVVWDRIEIVTVTFDDSRVNIGANAEVRFKLRYDWDDVQFDSGKGSITGYVWDAANEWWDKSVTAPVTVGSELYDENDFAVTDSTYGLTAEENDAGAILIGDQVHATTTAVVDTRININTAASITWALTYDFDEALMTDGAVTIEGVVAVHQGSGLWKITPTKTSAQAVTYDEFTATGNVHGITSVNAEGETDTVIWDALKCTAFTRDVANQKLHVRMLYAFDSSAAEGGTVSFVGIAGTANSEGWAEIALSGASNFDWGEEAYGTTDAVFDITATSENQTITLARYGQLIGGNAEVDDTSTWNGVSLVLDFSLGLGDYYTDIVTTTPSYIYNVAYDLGTDLSGGVLRLTHDGSQSSITMARKAWSGTFVQAVPSGYLTTATMASNVLTLTVSSATSVTDDIIVDCTGRGMPQTITGFDSTPLYEDPDLTGSYTTNVTLTLDWGFGAGSEPGETGGVGGTTTVITTVVPYVYLMAIQGETNDGVFDILWSSPITSITIRAITFLDHSDWFAINASAPFKLEDSILNPEKMDSIKFTVSPDADARIGNYSIPVEFQLEEAAIANTVIYLSILKTPVAARLLPDTGPIPNIVGVLIGVGALVAIGVTLLRRGKFNGGRFRV